jgi:hypothetical protein
MQLVALFRGRLLSVFCAVLGGCEKLGKAIKPANQDYLKVDAAASTEAASLTAVVSVDHLMLTKHTLAGSSTAEQAL